MPKRIVVTSRGQKLDFDALKRANPNVKPIVAGAGYQKQLADKIKNQKKSVPPARVARINATIPAPIPKASAPRPLSSTPTQKPTVVSQPSRRNKKD
jgi:hypothetical protein